MNKNKLLAVITEHGDNQSKLADCLGISRVTLSKKINEKHNAVFTSLRCQLLKGVISFQTARFQRFFFT